MIWSFWSKYLCLRTMFQIFLILGSWCSNDVRGGFRKQVFTLKGLTLPFKKLDKYYKKNVINDQSIKEKKIDNMPIWPIFGLPSVAHSWYDILEPSLPWCKCFERSFMHLPQFQTFLILWCWLVFMSCLFFGPQHFLQSHYLDLYRASYLWAFFTVIDWEYNL